MTLRTGSEQSGSWRTPVAIVGPTCTGKTRLAVALARRMHPAELLNADSRQLRRGLQAGTCVPTPDELAGVACHLLDLAEPGQEFTVADWLLQARAVLTQLTRRGAQPIVVGGTGLYVTALVQGYDFGGVPPDPTTRLERTRIAATAAGREQLAAELSERDPAAASALDLRNPRRVIRALEILDGRGRLLDVRGSNPEPVVLIGLDAPRDLHETWVLERTTAMFRSGAIVEETRAALGRGLSGATLRGCGIGYAEALALLDGSLGVDAAIDSTTRRTLRYAKAQRAYFRRDSRITWLDAGGSPGDLLAAALAAVNAAEQPAHSA